MTPDQSKATEAILNMILKALFGLSALVGWWIILIKLIFSSTTFDAVKLGILEGLLTGSIYIVFKHYFGKIRD